MNQVKNQNRRKGTSSFSLPKVIVENLIAQRASALEICFMLVIAQHTEALGVFSTCAVKAISFRCGVNKPKAKKLLESLRNRRITYFVTEPNEDGTPIVKERTEPMLYSRDDLLRINPNFKFPDKGRPIQFAIPPCNEKPWDRVWFGSNLVLGFGDFTRPLTTLRHLTDPATHLLLHIYATTNMGLWGGACPVGDRKAPSRPYHIEYIGDFEPNLSLHTATRIQDWNFEDVLPQLPEYRRSLPHALKQLIDAGLVYEVITAFDADVLSNDSLPLYQLYSINGHGEPVDGEHGVARFIAQTAGSLGHPLWDETGQFNHTYGVIVQAGQAVCVHGLLRPRFRVTNPRNAGVSDGWQAILERDREAFRMIQSWRIESGLPALPDPFDTTN